MPTIFFNYLEDPSIKPRYIEGTSVLMLSSLSLFLPADFDLSIHSRPRHPRSGSVRGDLSFARPLLVAISEAIIQTRNERERGKGQLSFFF